MVTLSLAGVMHWTLCAAHAILYALVVALSMRMATHKPSSASRSNFLYLWLLTSAAVVFAGYSSVLLSQGRHTAWAVSSLLFATQMGLSCKVHTSDPGVVTAATASANSSLMGYCETCSLERPVRAKHCRLCDHCVRTFDHHCIILDVCIGERNHRPFVSLLLLASVNGLTAMHVLSTGSWWTSAFTPVALCQASLLTVCVWYLLLVQCCQIALGLTTNERLNMRHKKYSYLRSPTGLSAMVLNCYRFAWDGTWHQGQQEEDHSATAPPYDA